MLHSSARELPPAKGLQGDTATVGMPQCLGGSSRDEFAFNKASYECKESDWRNPYVVLVELVVGFCFTLLLEGTLFFYFIFFKQNVHRK